MSIKGGILFIAFVIGGTVLTDKITSPPSLPHENFQDYSTHFQGGIHSACNGQALLSYTTIGSYNYVLLWRAPRLLVARYAPNNTNEPDWIWTADIEEGTGVIHVKKSIRFSDDLPAACQMLGPAFDPTALLTMEV